MAETHGENEEFLHWPKIVRDHMRELYKNSPSTSLTENDGKMNDDSVLDVEAEHSGILSGIDADLKEVIQQEELLHPQEPDSPQENNPTSPFENAEKTPTRLHVLLGGLMEIQRRSLYLLENKILTVEDKDQLQSINRSLERQHENLQGLMDQIQQDPKNQIFIAEVNSFIQRTTVIIQRLNVELEWLYTHRENKPQS